MFSLLLQVGSYLLNCCPHHFFLEIRPGIKKSGDQYYSYYMQQQHKCNIVANIRNYFFDLK